MGFFDGAIMGWLKATGAIVAGLFSPSEGKTTGGELLKDMSNGIDAMFYTEQEEVRDEIKVMELKQVAFNKWLEMMPALKDSEAQRSVTRRILAIGSVLFIFMLITVCVISEAYCLYKGLPRVSMPLPWSPAHTTMLSPLTISVVVIATVFSLGTVLICIIGFYFGPPLFNALRGKNQ